MAMLNGIRTGGFRLLLEATTLPKLTVLHHSPANSKLVKNKTNFAKKVSHSTVRSFWMKRTILVCNNCSSMSFKILRIKQRFRTASWASQGGRSIKTCKADSLQIQQFAFSTVDCVNAEIENFLSLCGNETVHCGIHTSVYEALKTSSKCFRGGVRVVLFVDEAAGAAGIAVEHQLAVVLVYKV